MIQEKHKSNVQEVSKGAVSTGFNIEINESMFQMLTSKVYNDPTLAVIREWSTNACDACIVAKKEPKYNVHIPVAEELYFSVRDYGTGLHPDSIVGLFSTLGSSTKRNSNELNGTFGIGRMAGLAVASGFSVDSYYEGVMYSYAISVQNGVPVTISLGEQKTTEPNGLKLLVAVDIEDVHHYQIKAQNLYKYFDHKPILNIDLNIELDTTEHISDEWFIKTNCKVYETANYVVMSQIAYAIPEDSKIKNCGFRNLIIKAPAGAVSFNPGRESLSLTKETILYINNRFLEIKEEYIHLAIMSISEGTNDKEVNKIANKVIANAPDEIRDLIDPKAFYSKYLTSMIFSSHSHSARQTKEFAILTNNKINLAQKYNYRKNIVSLYENTSLRVRDLLNTSHVVIDLKTKFKTVLSKEYENKTAVVWSRQDGVEIEDFLKEVEKVTKAMGITYVLASKLVEKYSTSELLGNNNINTSREGLYASDINKHTHTFGKSTKISENTAQAHTYLYVKLKNTTVTINHPTLNLSDFIDVYELLKKIRIMPVIKGVPKKYQHIADSLDNWVDLEQFILDRVKESKFKIPLEVKIPSFSKERISYDSLSLYPKVIQDYYSEITSYKKFNTTKDFIPDISRRNLLKSMGAAFYSYTPTKDVDLDVIERDFSYTIRLLTLSYFPVDLPQYFVAGISALEEKNALRTTS
jgi:hypothetical protein